MCNFKKRGILLDGDNAFDVVDDDDSVGVHADASPPWELFSPGDEKALLELRLHGNITEAKHGPKGRYVLKSDQSAASDWNDCEVQAILLLHDSAPDFVKNSC